MHGWQEWQKWFLDTKKFLVLAIFWSFFKYHGSKKCPKPKKLLTWKISFFMPVNHMKEYLISIHISVVFHTFMSELQIAPITPILGINVPNLVQVLLRTCYLLIWPRQLEVRRSGLPYYIYYVGTSANLLPGNQVASPKLVNNMSSRVSVPSLGHLFPKLE